MKKIIIILFFCLLATGCSNNIGGRIDGSWIQSNNVLRPANTNIDFMVGSTASTTADFYCDVSKDRCYMINADISGTANIINASIGSISLVSEILTPLKIRYSTRATSSLISESKAGVLTLSAASSTYPSQLALYQNGTVYSNGKLLNGTSTACITYTASTSFTTVDMNYRVALGFPITISKVRCRVQGGTSLNLGITDGTNLMSTTTCGTAQTISYPSANNTFVKDESIILDIENGVGSPDYIYYYCFDYSRT